MTGSAVDPSNERTVGGTPHMLVLSLRSSRHGARFGEYSEIDW
jgi:hypothetical protein